MFKRNKLFTTIIAVLLLITFSSCCALALFAGLAYGVYVLVDTYGEGIFYADFLANQAPNVQVAIKDKLNELTTGGTASQLITSLQPEIDKYQANAVAKAIAIIDEEGRTPTVEDLPPISQTLTIDIFKDLFKDAIGTINIFLAGDVQGQFGVYGAGDPVLELAIQEFTIKEEENWDAFLSELITVELDLTGSEPEVYANVEPPLIPTVVSVLISYDGIVSISEHDETVVQILGDAVSDTIEQEGVSLKIMLDDSQSITMESLESIKCGKFELSVDNVDLVNQLISAFYGQQGSM